MSRVMATVRVSAEPKFDVRPTAESREREKRMITTKRKKY